MTDLYDAAVMTAAADALGFLHMALTIYPHFNTFFTPSLMVPAGIPSIKHAPASAEVQLHLDRCLSCLSCMSTCPSGVDYMHLIDLARGYVEQTAGRPFKERFVRKLLALVLPYPERFRLALRVAPLGRPWLKLLRHRVVSPRMAAFTSGLRSSATRAASGSRSRGPNVGWALKGCRLVCRPMRMPAGRPATWAKMRPPASFAAADFASTSRQDSGSRSFCTRA